MFATFNSLLSDESGLGASPAFAAETTQGIRGMFPLFFNPPQLTGQKQGANQAGAASHPQVSAVKSFKEQPSELQQTIVQ